MNYPILPWIANPQHPCPCGSLLSYCKCCEPNNTIKDQWWDFQVCGDHAKAEAALRAKLTEYIGFVIRHTIPLLKAGANPAGLLAIDVNALDEICSNLVFLLHKRGASKSIIPQLRHVKNLLNLQEVHERFLFLEMLSLVVHLDAGEEASRMAQRIRDPFALHDVKLLQIYLQLRTEELTLPQHIALADKILALCHDPCEKLQYGIWKSMILEFAGDSQGAESLQQAVIAETIPVLSERAKQYDLFICGRALDHRWHYSEDLQDIRVAREFYLRIDQSLLTMEGRANLLHEIGGTFLKCNELEDAIRYETHSHLLLDDGRALIWRMEAYIRACDIPSARKDYENLVVRNLPPDVALEFALTASRLALRTGDRALAADVIKYTSDIKMRWHYFAAQRDGIKMRLLEFLTMPEDIGGRQGLLAKLGSLWEMARYISTFLELKPNVFGIGLNLNEALKPKQK